MRGWALPEVHTVSGGPKQGTWTPHGYADGRATTDAQFHRPVALAWAESGAAGGRLYVADEGNHAVRVLEEGWVYTFLPNDVVGPTWIRGPIGVAVDGEGVVYVLNRGESGRGWLLRVDAHGHPAGASWIVATNLMHPQSLALDRRGGAYVVVGDRQILWIGLRNEGSRLVATVSAPGAQLRGLTMRPDGMLAVCDAGLHGIWLVNPTNGSVMPLTGFNGPGDRFGAAAYAQFRCPEGIVAAGNNAVVVTDRGNHRVKVVDPAGAVYNLYGVCSNLWVGPYNPTAGVFPGWYDGVGCVTIHACDMCANYAEARDPHGITFARDGTLFVTETYYHILRQVSSAGLPPPPPWPPAAPQEVVAEATVDGVTVDWRPVRGAVRYRVKRSTTAGGPYSVLSEVVSPPFRDAGVLPGTTYYYVVTALNDGGESLPSAEVRVSIPRPPVQDPRIGYVEFPSTASPPYTSVFRAGQSFVFNNDVPIVIVGEAGAQTFYTYSNTLDLAQVANPTDESATAPAGYRDGLDPVDVARFAVVPVQPVVAVKAVSKKTDGSPDSQIVGAVLQFVTANPVVEGDNPADLRVRVATAWARLFYTLDGSDPGPENLRAVDAGLVGDPREGWSLRLFISSNTMLRLRAYKTNYQPSAVVSKLLSPTNLVVNRIGFGFERGVGATEFIAAPGQLFYAPVTMTVLPDTSIYSLQFSLMATNAGPLPGPPIPRNGFTFESLLVKPREGVAGAFERIPPLMYVARNTNGVPDVITNRVVAYNNGWFMELVFTNSAMNLLGVGWLERRWQFGTNLYNTTAQDLISYSMAHDTLLVKSDGRVLVGAYGIRVPSNAKPGQTYVIQVDRPTATSDGIGAPGSDVYIEAPAYGVLGKGPLNGVKVLTVGQPGYIVGDVYPFRWFNAGDFGKGWLANADVMQVFQVIAYGFNAPPAGSDLFDAMDSCCGVFTNASWDTNLLVKVGDGSQPIVRESLFDGNDTDINRIAFGDGQLDVCDLFVTFRRSLDPSLAWFKRLWTTNGQVAVVATNNFRGRLDPWLGPWDLGLEDSSLSGEPPAVVIEGREVIGQAGALVEVPVVASVFGPHPLRVLAITLRVVPADGSPWLEEPVRFEPSVLLGAPTLVDSSRGDTYAAAWLRNDGTGIVGTNAIVGWLRLRIPASASGNAAYVIQMLHSSGSPNGLAPFSTRARNGVVALRDRSGSSWGDGIPDWWRLRYFGSIAGILGAADADADGDGVLNRSEYETGTDPTDPTSHTRMTVLPRGRGDALLLLWPSIPGLEYILEEAVNLGGPWTPVFTQRATGWKMSYQPSAQEGPRKFYRVRFNP
ncbi:hypothetical protein [Limisphaera sp. VF-2]|uniref:NHL repeat-containing protein n=1 Tax=Limisphaera sp. VF-2 TaxID=3400418 RepID=UPI003C2472A2